MRDRIDELFELDRGHGGSRWRYTRAPESELEGHPDWWAVDVWFATAFQCDEARVRAAIIALIERAPEGADLGYVGAGPLEDFICRDEERLAWVEAQAARSADFRRALANVWLDPELDPFFDRIERAAGVPLKRPLPWPERSRDDPEI